MKYFFDTEFHERIKSPFFGKKHHLMELISIGIVDQDGREYYAISCDFDLKAAWKNEWLRENVLKPIHEELCEIENQYPTVRIWFGHLWESFTYSSMKTLISWHGKHNDQIAAEIFDFVNPDLGFHVSGYNNSEFRNPEHPMSLHFERHNIDLIKDHYYAQPEFYAYYADYDWVLLCSLFGSMMNLPPGFPMHCKDLKQYLDQAATLVPDINDLEPTLKNKLLILKVNGNYPVNKGEHNALADAKWNHELYHFLNAFYAITM